MVVDSAELYPWKFPGARVTRRKLPVGEYALVEDERLVAMVEGKTRESLLGNMHGIEGLHDGFGRGLRRLRSTRAPRGS